MPVLRYSLLLFSLMNRNKAMKYEKIVFQPYCLANLLSEGTKAVQRRKKISKDALKCFERQLRGMIRGVTT